MYGTTGLNKHISDGIYLYRHSRKQKPQRKIKTRQISFRLTATKTLNRMKQSNYDNQKLKIDVWTILF